MRVLWGTSVGHKRALDEDPLEEAQKTWATMRSLSHADLQNPSKVTRLPYPGLGAPTRRPPADLQIVGIKDVATMLEVWHRVPAGHSILLVGGKGVGKSVRLRIFACIQLTLPPKKSRLVCIWDMSSVRDHLFECLVDALMFTYAEEEDVAQEIRSLNSLNDLKAFLVTRKKGHGETFSFILDGAMDLDVTTWYGEVHSDAKQRLEASLKLSGFLHGCKTIWGLSPKADKVQRDQLHPLDDVTKLVCDEGFDEESMRTFSSISIVGAVLQKFPDRKADVEYYAGNYPWFLHILDSCCRDISLEKEKKACEAEGIQMPDPETMNVAYLADLLQDQEDWDAAVSGFAEHHVLQSIRGSLEMLEINRPYHDLKHMIHADARYALNREMGLFSSPYIESIYIDAFRAKEHELDKTEIAGPWVAYSKLVLRQPVVYWAETGWICERLCTDVVSRMGIVISDDLDIGELKAEHFSKIPKIPLRMLKPGHGFFYIPNRYNYDKWMG